jgi:hypothetical protein
MTETQFHVGDAVRTQRDETLFPPAGTWHRYRNRPGFVVQVNDVEGHVEYGVILTVTRPPWRNGRKGELSYDSDMVSWFAPHELVGREG